MLDENSVMFLPTETKFVSLGSIQYGRMGIASELWGFYQFPPTLILTPSLQGLHVK